MRSYAITIICVYSLITIGAFSEKGMAEPNTSLYGGINYAYSTWVGTGYYSIGDQHALILRGRMAVPLLESQPRRKWQVDLLLEGTIGFYDLLTRDTKVAAVTAVPGLMVTYQVRENWWLKPFGQIGIGKDFSGGDTALIGAAGLKSLAAFPKDGGVVWELGNSLMFADNSNSDDNVSDDGFSMFEIGFNRRTPIGFRMLGQATDLNLFFVYTEFLNDLQFFQVDFNDTRLKRQYQFGIAFTGPEKFSIFGFTFGGAGVDVTLGNNYVGIGVNTGFPF